MTTVKKSDLNIITGDSTLKLTKENRLGVFGLRRRNESGDFIQFCDENENCFEYILQAFIKKIIQL